VNIVNTLALRLPKARYLVGAVLIGLAAWVPAHELFVLQSAVLHVPDELLDDARLVTAFEGQPLIWALVLIAVVPAICEELLFRGFLLQGVATLGGKWKAIVIASVVFAIFHMLLIKFALTMGLGLVLGYLCWQSRSIIPSMIAHALHNGSAVMLAFWAPYKSALGLSDLGPVAHLPMPLILVSTAMVIVGIVLVHGQPPGVHAGLQPEPA